LRSLTDPFCAHRTCATSIDELHRSIRAHGCLHCPHRGGSVSSHVDGRSQGELARHRRVNLVARRSRRSLRTSSRATAAHTHRSALAAESSVVGGLCSRKNRAVRYHVPTYRQEHVSFARAMHGDKEHNHHAHAVVAADHHRLHTCSNTPCAPTRTRTRPCICACTHMHTRTLATTLQSEKDL
jgi:hypothetical protein